MSTMQLDVKGAVMGRFAKVFILAISLVVTSKACEDTVEMGERFTDAGHPVISFKMTALKK
jgi:hypothetical protein